MELDVMLFGNLDYLFDLSNDNNFGNLTLKPNVVIGSRTEPANVRVLHVDTCGPVEYEQKQEIIQTIEAKAKNMTCHVKVDQRMAGVMSFRNQMSGSQEEVTEDTKTG
jgi:hypothetical protein